MNIKTALLGLLVASPAFADASLSGKVTDVSSAPLQNIQVRLWQQSGKSWSVAAAVTTDVNGDYAFTAVPAGDYKLDARMGPGVGGNYGDRWYDVLPPTSNGYIGADADLITLADMDALIGFDLVLEVLGGADGQVQIGGNPAAGILVLGEQAGEPRIHHTDQSQSGPHQGRFYMRGLVPSADYRFLLHELTGAYETRVEEGPFTITPGSNATLPAFSLVPRAADPYEPNETPTPMGGAVDSLLFRMNPPQPFTTSGMWVGPRNSGDTDWFCFDALAGDRFLIAAKSELTLATGTRANPFVDPVVALYSGDGMTRLFEDDDSGPGALDALLDTGILSADGRYCAVVTTYGDTLFDGTNQGSAGNVEVTIAMGNRRPTLEVTSNGTATPPPPQFLTIDEGQSVTLDLAFSDPDADMLSVTAVHEDALGAPVTTGVFTPGTNTATFTWMADQQAATGSPYTVTLSAGDAEFTETVEVIIEVNAVNLTPTTPVQLAPADGATLATATPTLSVSNSTDGDNDPLSYEFELYYNLATTPDQTQSVAEGGGGQTDWPVAAVPENTVARWRARAYDGQGMSGYSPWTGEWSFFVDTANDPPSIPVIVKPQNGEEVMVRGPGLSAANPLDPEGDAVELVFEYAKTQDFTSADISPRVPMNTAATTTTWTIEQSLPWGSTWFARAKAFDARGGESAYSDVVQFKIKDNTAPTLPGLGAPFDAQCQGLVMKTDDLASIVVTASEDPEGEPLSLELRVFEFQADPESSQPLFQEAQNQPQDGSAVTFTVSVMWKEDQQYRVRARAYDGSAYSEWAECDLLIDAVEGNGGGGDGNGNGDGQGVKEGCGCSAGFSPSLLFGALGLLFALGRRRRVPQA